MSKGQLFQHILMVLIIASVVALGWYSVFYQQEALVEENIIAFQYTELEITRSTARLSLPIHTAHSTIPPCILKQKSSSPSA